MRSRSGEHMTVDEVLEALAGQRATVADDCVRSARANIVSATFPPAGLMTVREARVLYEHRRSTMAAARIPYDGLDRLLEDLANRDADEQLAIAGFSGAHESYVAFLDAHGVSIGCVRVEKGRHEPR
jgi:hypothetical protein